MRKSIDMPKKRPTQESPPASDTRLRILSAGTKIFAQKGFDGARVDAIAAEAGVNKERLYHYFGNKDGLFSAVLEAGYRNLREAEARVAVGGLPANEAVLRLVEFTWAYYQEHPEFIRLLNSANQLEGRHLKTVEDNRGINAAHIGLMESLVARGAKEGSMRADLDPIHLSVNIAALTYFYLMNRFTLSIVFERDFGAQAALADRLAVMKDVVARWISPASVRADSQRH